MPRKIYLSLAICWTTLMFFLCLEDSGDLPKIKIPNLDKFVHAGFHLVFVVVWFFYFREAKNFSKNERANKKVFFLSILFGITIELLQYYFTTTRKADFLDVLCNTVGTLIAFFSIRLWNNNQKIKKLY